MTDIEVIKQQIEELESLAAEIEDEGTTVLREATLEYRPHEGVPVSDYQWGVLPSKLKDTQRDCIRKYQRFYSAGVHFVKEYIPEREEEFSECYKAKSYTSTRGIMDYLQLRRPPYKPEIAPFIDQFRDRFEIQRSILCSVPSLVKIKEMRLREIISADFVDREIFEAEFLYQNRHYRAAGALTGVALESHLKTLCDKYRLVYQKKDTIEPLSQKLYESGKIDVSQLKNIQHLASIRDKCDHASEVEQGEVKELIERVKRIL